MNRQTLITCMPNRRKDRSAQARLRAPLPLPKNLRSAQGPEAAADEVGQVVAEERPCGGAGDQQRDPRVGAARGGHAESDDRDLAGEDLENGVEGRDDHGDGIGERGVDLQAGEWA
jgi:hypothetical protein